jgi:predicted HicB family RNase H-like nuclease
MVKLTVRIDDPELHRQLEVAASEDERSLNGEIVWLLRAGLDSRSTPKGAPTVHPRRTS